MRNPGKYYICLLLFYSYFIFAESHNATNNEKINLNKKIEPVDKVIEFLKIPFPRLAEPSIIHFNIYNPPISVKEEEIRDIGERLQKSFDRSVNKSPLNDTLINGIFQSIFLDKKIYKQGEVATLNVTAVLPLINPQIKFLNKIYKLYSAGKNTYRTILGVPMDADTGRHYMTLKYEENGKKGSYRIPFRVIPGDFAEEDTSELDLHILTEETLEMLKYESRYFHKAYGTTFDTLLLDGDFIWPCPGSITSPFGIARRYNNGLDKWSHKAIDISNSIGTKVYAANRGIVVMAEELEGHGKSVVIAHGQGIHTVYLHLDKIFVAKGDTVIKGQEIGEMGKTGMCTGPNLHFQIMVNMIPTDPRCWIPGGNKLKKGNYVKPGIVKKQESPVCF
jgi:murein DD-endopeptidase MepM/ murein hydrolase activator NlpD|uniref:M23 family metallopeptidase n=1 Tax=candidate division WOR-3 bacterium TaxID=2052148 RepID=A0A7V3RI22_UNCW3